MTGTKPARDFTDLAIWRGGLAAIVVGYLLSMSISAMRYGAAGFDVALLANTLRFALEPAPLVMGVTTMGVAVVIGFFVMAAYKGDHTTFRAALVIGARTGAIVFAIAAVLGLLLSLSAITATGMHGFGVLVGPAIVGLLVAIAVGAVTGLAARLAAGAPTVERQLEPA
jgi:hypothetical protein